MAIDTSIYQNQPSPLEMLARVQAIKSQQQQQQIGQQQLQAATLENQQRQLDLSDQQNFRSAYTEAGGDPEKTLQIAAKKGIGPKAALAFQQQIFGLAKERAALKGSDLDNLSKQNDAMNALLAPVEAEKDPAKQAALWDQQLQAGVQQGIIPAQSAQNHPYPGPDGVHQYRSSINTDKWINAQAAQMNAQREQDKYNDEKGGLQAKSASEQLAAAAPQIDGVKDQAGYMAWLKQLAPRTVSQLPPTFDPATTPALIKRMAVPAQQQPNFDIETAKANAIKSLSGNPQAAVAQIDQIIPPTVAGNAEVNNAYKTLVKGSLARGDFEGAKSALEHAAEYAAGIAKETNPQVINSRVNQAVATAKATAPIEIQKEVDKQLAIAKNSPDAFGAIADPRARAAAQVAYEKDSREFADKTGAAQQFTDFITAAQSGNKAAPGLIPIADVRALLNRVNRQELQSVSTGAGSLLDRLQGKLNGLADGQPIPPAVLTDMKKISGLMQQSAERTYKYKVGVTNQTYGSKAQPINLDTATGKIVVKAADGSVHPFDSEDQAKSFEQLVKQAGGSTTRQ